VIISSSPNWNRRSALNLESTSRTIRCSGEIRLITIRRQNKVSYNYAIILLRQASKHSEAKSRRRTLGSSEVKEDLKWVVFIMTIRERTKHK
jgi:hypothetical protein